MSETDINCFVAKCTCGGLIFASVDEPTPQRRKDNAKEVAALIRKGYRIENMPVSQVRMHKFCFAKHEGRGPAAA